jgi:hypothetical protein
MHTGKGQVVELVLRDGLRQARLACQPTLIPAPGQYLLVSGDMDFTLPDPVYRTDSMPDGFLAAPAPGTWHAGMDLSLRGPFGRGFELPATARRVVLVPFAAASSRLQPLIPLALEQDAAVVLVSDRGGEHLPDAVEVQPRAELGEILSWADWIAFDIEREELPELRALLGKADQFQALKDASIFVHTPVPCGGAAECGVCAVVTKSGWRMACKDGPVFRWGEI